MIATFNRDRTVAVDPDYCWQPMHTCPLGVKVQLLGAGGVATYGHFVRAESFWRGWAPLPKTSPLAERPATSPEKRPENCATGFCSCIECHFSSVAQENQTTLTRPMTQLQIESMMNNMGIYDGDYETAIVRAAEKHHEIKGATQ